MFKKIPVFLSFLALFLIAWGSNTYDWDHFLTGWESDLQSWLIDHTPPTWSYLFCGGLTRVGDPQAFGLSPFFALTFILGTFLTTKVFVLLSSLAGAYGISELLRVLTPEYSREERWIWGALWSTSFYFLWHIHSGHLTFMLMHWQVLWIGFLFRVLAQERSRPLLTFLLCWCIFSAGFYHSTLFFFLPTLLALALSLPFVRSRELIFQKEGLKFLGASSLGLLLASYKWWGVITHQSHYPRTLTQDIPDTNVWIQVLHSFLLPTPSGEYLARIGPAFTRGPYEIWEYSAFSLIPLLLIVVCILVCILRKTTRKAPPLAPFGLISSGMLILLGLWLSLGLSANPSLFDFVNSHFLKGSMRVAGRFQIVALLGMLLLTAQLLTRWTLPSPRIRSTILTLALLIQLGVAFEFWPRLDFAYASSLFRLKPQVSEQLREVLFQTPDQWGNPTHMYPVLLSGVPVLNCYNPLASDWYAKHAPRSALEGHRWDEPFRFLIPPPTQSLAPECVDRSYFTRSRVVIDTSCPRGTCLMLNSLRESDRNALSARLRTDSGTYCIH